MSDVPKARRILYDRHAKALAAGDRATARDLEAALRLLYRRALTAPVAPKRSKPFTPEVAEAMRAHKRRNPKASQMEIAKRFDCCAGRVSEALHGDR